MKEYLTKEIRNIALLGHASTGKTVLGEAMYFSTGKSSRMGKIDDGTTISDYHEDEIARKFSISSSLICAEWNEKKLNIIDTPGYLDFISESKAITRVVDFGLIVVNSMDVSVVGTDLVNKFSKADNLPCGFAINMLDKEHAAFEKALESLQNSFGKNVIPLQIPINEGVDFDSIIDIIANKMLTFSKDSRGKATTSEVPADLKAKVEEMRENLIEFVAESDDELLEKFFDEGTLSDEELSVGLKKAILSRNLFPVFATSGFNNIGVTNMMNLICSYAPCPSDRDSVKGSLNGKEIVRKIDDNEPTSLFVFKTSSELHVGELSVFKVISGILRGGGDLYNCSSKNNERIGQIYSVNGKVKTEVAHMHAGDIGAVVKLKHTHTNDTLAESKNQIEYPKINFPNPVVRVAVTPKSRADEDKINIGLQTLQDEDPTFHYEYDAEIKQTIISGQGELHLKISLDRLKEKYNVEVDQIKPKIPYRETIKKRAEAKYRHKKQSGGAGQFAEVWLRVEPLERGSGIVFEDKLVGQNVDRVFVPSVEKGIKACCSEGIIAGCHVTDLKATFYDGKMHPVDSKDIAFQIAGKGAFRECVKNATPSLLEPVYQIDVTVPEEFMGDVMGDVSTRRGKVLGMDTEGHFQTIKAHIPLSELYQYGTSLRSMTQGKGLHKQKFSHYDPVPHEIQEKIIAEYKKEKEED